MARGRVDGEGGKARRRGATHSSCMLLYALPVMLLRESPLGMGWSLLPARSIMLAQLKVMASPSGSTAYRQRAGAGGRQGVAGRG